MKTNIKPVTLAVLFLYAIGGIAQSEFQQTYGTNNSDQGASVHITQDGGFIMSANSYGDLLSTGSVNQLLIKTNNLGGIEWVAAADSNSSNRMSVVTENTADSSFVVGTYSERNHVSNPGRGNVWFYSVDKNGNLKWSKIFAGDNNGTSSYDEIDDIIPTSDGNFFAIGYSDNSSYTTGVGAYDAILYKIDPNGNMLWAKALGTTDYDWGQCIIPTSDGNYLVGGQYYDFSSFHILMMKIDINGNVIWSNTYGGNGFSSLGTSHPNYGNTRPSHSSLIETSDGGYVAVGYTDGYGSGGDDILCIKVNSSGALSWAKAIGSTGREQAAGVAELSNTNLIIAAAALGSLSGSNNDVLLLSMDATGNLLWTKSYESGAGGGPNEYPGSIRNVGDGTVVVSGTINNASTNGNDIFLMKINTSGVTACIGSDALAATNRTPIVVDISASLTVNANGSSTLVTPVLVGDGNHGLVTINETNLCAVVLPIELTSFNARCNEGAALIEWTTLSELNNDYFTLERSIDAVNWEEVSTILGQGNSSIDQDYKYLDFDFKSGVSYYRLKQTDFDGRSTYSNMIGVTCQNGLSLPYPNPTSGLIHYRATANSQVTLYNAMGQMVLDRYIEANSDNMEIKLDLSHLSKGIYIFNVQSQGNMESHKLEVK